MDLEEEVAEEAEEDSPDWKPLNVEHVREKDICQEGVLNPNASYVIKRDIQRSSALENQ